jgi:hypothetical protein
MLRYLFGVEWRRSQGCWIRLGCGSTGDLLGHLPLLPEQAHEGLREETLRPLKTKILNKKTAVSIRILKHGVKVNGS